AAAQYEQADEAGEQRDEDDREKQRKRDLPREPVLLRDRGGIGADAIPGAVPEGGEAGEADQQGEAERGDRQAHDLRRRVGGKAERVQDEGQQHEPRESDPECPVPAHSNFSMRSPRSPRGRNMSTRNISTYIEASPAAGAKWMVIPRTTPTSSAESTTP